MNKKSRKRNARIVPSWTFRYPLDEICGEWKSPEGSPGIRIYYDGSRFRLVFEYNPDAAFTVSLEIDCRGRIFYCFYGRMFLSYNMEEDLLMHSTEGIYQRVYD